MQITVSATAESQQAPTRAVVQARVLTEGASPTQATSAASKVSEQVADTVREAESAQALEKWSQNALTTWSSRPWKDDGTQGEPVFYASVNFAVTFTDFTVLAQWLASNGLVTGVEIQSVTWGLSEQELEQATALVQAQAVSNAHTKATTLARAAGYDAVCFTEIADTGLLSNAGSAESGSGYGPGGVMARSAMFKDSSALEVRPEDVTISASVHARFSAKKNF